MTYRLALYILTLIAVVAVPPGRAQDAAVATVVPIAVNGDPAARFSLVVMGDGYTASELPKYRAQLDKHLNVLWSIEPFRSYRNYINVYSVEIASAESGITCDPETRQQRKTPLGAHFQDGCTNPNARGILVDQKIARDYAARATPQFDQILVLANTETYGGIGGGVATTSGGNSLGVLITPHELGHSLGRLQDEYTYYQRGVAGGQYSQAEPQSIHHTLMTDEEMRAKQAKWFRWLGDESLSGGTIGRYEGGQYMTRGIWRPSRHSMMISVGYYFDQVSRERMVQRISQQVNLIADARPSETPAGTNEVLWIETAHPNYHELEITWEVDGKEHVASKNLQYLDLKTLTLADGQHQVSVKVVDPTPFVRDPAIRTGALTAARTWTVSGRSPVAAVATSITGATQANRPVGATEVLYVTTANPPTSIPRITWQVNGRTIETPAGARTLSLSALNLPSGTHTVTATLAGASGDGSSRTWIVDNTMPDVKFAVATPVETRAMPDGTPHYVVRDEFTLKLEPSDDQKGYVVAEFRVNGDGWHHYYGWPDAPEGTPFRFTPRGTTIKELVYGSLSSEGLSPQPWEERKPGYGTHRIEYRAIDAAGNIGPAKAFMVTVEPSK